MPDLNKIPSWTIAVACVTLTALTLYVWVSGNNLILASKEYGFNSSQTVKPKPVQQFLPGMVVAFRKPCPKDKGWSRLKDADGKVIFGATLTKPFSPFEKGGKQEIIIEAENLPAHSHLLGAGWFEKLKPGATTHLPDGTKNTGAGTKTSEDISGFTKKPKPISNLPPYIALYYCIKS